MTTGPDESDVRPSEPSEEEDEKDEKIQPDNVSPAE